MTSHTSAVLLCLILSITMRTVYTINCYQCSGTDSDNPFDCNEFLDGETDVVPTDCESIHNAQYCIKHVGRYEGIAIECYQCNSSATMECGDGLMSLDGGILKPTPCDHVYNAIYCIKQTGLLTQVIISECNAKSKFCGGLFKGGISTKRFCSSLDLGNYCNYVHQVGDKLEYRTCIYTCGTDGCNAAGSLSVSVLVTLLAFFVYKCVA